MKLVIHLFNCQLVLVFGYLWILSCSRLVSGWLAVACWDGKVGGSWPYWSLFIYQACSQLVRNFICDFILF